MTRTLAFLLIVFTACAYDPDRQISSIEAPVVIGEVDLTKSEVRYLPPENPEHDDQQLFLLSLKSPTGESVDVDPSHVKILKSKIPIPSQFERVSQGRYTLLIKSENLDDVVLKLDQKYFSLKQPKKLLPSSQKSSVRVLKNQRHELVLQIDLRDRGGKPVLLEDIPEIIFEGAEIVTKDLQLVKTGLWELKIQYPEENFILYVSIRANGVLLRRIYRLQHIEK